MPGRAVEIFTAIPITRSPFLNKSPADFHASSSPFTLSSRCVHFLVAHCSSTHSIVVCLSADDRWNQAIPSSVKTAPPAQPDDNPFTSEEHDHNLDMSAQRVATPYMSVASHPDGSRETLQPTPKLDLGSALWVLGVAQSSEQPSNRRLWSRRVARFSCGHAEDVIPIDSTAVKVARDIGRGVAIIVVIPIALAVAGLAGAGVIVYGFGLVLRGIGSAFTCGVAN